MEQTRHIPTSLICTSCFPNLNLTTALIHCKMLLSVGSSEVFFIYLSIYIKETASWEAAEMTCWL